MTRSGPPPLEPTPLAEPLDEYLREVVRTLQTAVNQGLRRAADDPQAATRQISDCHEIIDVIMSGHVQEWIA